MYLTKINILEMVKMDKKIEYFFGELHLIGNFLVFLMSLSTIILVSITLYNIVLMD